MEDERIKISKDTQKFITDVSMLPNDKYNKVMDFLENLKNQQEAEAHLENKRGWRYMWQRTPKPFLVMMGYFVGFGSIGSFGYSNYPKATGFEEIYLISLIIIMVSPLILVTILSYYYIKTGLNKKNERREIDDNQ